MTDNLVDLGDRIGFDALDAEVNVFIGTGAYDDAVLERASDIWRFENDVAQRAHRAMHPDGPWGWEYCGHCSRTFEIRQVT